MGGPEGLYVAAAVAGGAVVGAAIALAGAALHRPDVLATTTNTAVSGGRRGKPATKAGCDACCTSSGLVGRGRHVRDSAASSPEPWRQDEQHGASCSPRGREQQQQHDQQQHKQQYEQQQEHGGQHSQQQQQHHHPDPAPPRAPARNQRRRPAAAPDGGGGGAGHDGGCSGAFAASFNLVSPIDAKKRSDPYDTSARTGYLQWDDYFMSVAFLSAQRSKDPNKQVGAVIVSPDNIILSIGYNGFPRGCPDERLPWAKKSRSGNVLDTKYPYVVHAEANALLNKNQASVAGTRVYVTMFPCNECAKLLIQAGICEVIYHESKAESVRHHPALTAPLSGDSCAASRSCSAGNLTSADAGQQQQQQQPDDADDDARAFAFPALGPAAHGRAGCSNGGDGGGGAGPAAHVAVGAPDAGYVASRRLLTMAGVRLRQHKLNGLIVVNPGG